MTNREKYENAFSEALGIEPAQAKGLEYQGIQEWDSIGHMELVSALEDAFGIEMETDDIVDFSSYDKGIEILSKYGVVI